MDNLIDVFNNYNICVSNVQEKQFDDFYEFLTQKNKVMNLTAITEKEDVLFKHFLDCCLPQDCFPKNCEIVDVGAGAGFPSIPLKILRPDLKITMLDSLNKRVNFLNETIKLLGLKNISAYHSRAEDFSKTHREKFDVATARAVSSLPTLLEYLLPLVKVGGIAIIYKSNKLDEELLSSQNALKILGGKIKEIKTYNILEKELTRNILIVEKVANTPQKYPRGKNEPKTKPL